MKFYLYFTFITTTLFLYSCTVTKNTVVNPQKIETIKPPLNEISETEVGENLVEKESGGKYKGLELTETFKFKHPSNTKPFELESGSIFILTQESTKYEYYTKEGSIWGIAIEKTSGKAELARNINGMGRYTLEGKEIPQQQYKTTNIPVLKSNYLRQEFIYNGKINTGLKFTYREFSNDLARPAFTQDLQYDLSEGNIVGFRGLRIEIINAQNTKIKYRVINYFK
jgi:hypothetical protein